MILTENEQVVPKPEEKTFLKKPKKEKLLAWEQIQHKNMQIKVLFKGLDFPSVTEKDEDRGVRVKGMVRGIVQGAPHSRLS